MAKTLKQLMGTGGAGLDDSMGFDNLYDVLKALVDAHQEVLTEFNQLKTDFDAHTHGGVTAGAASTDAPTASTATDLTSYVEAE